MTSDHEAVLGYSAHYKFLILSDNYRRPNTDSPLAVTTSSNHQDAHKVVAGIGKATVVTSNNNNNNNNNPVISIINRRR
jgi:hypothetical protein